MWIVSSWHALPGPIESDPRVRHPACLQLKSVCAPRSSGRGDLTARTESGAPPAVGPAEHLRVRPMPGQLGLTEKAADMALKAIVGEKVAMSQVWVNDKVVPVTVLRVEPARIVQVKTTERDGYTALQVTYGHKDAKKLTKPQAGHFAKAGVQPGRKVVELRVDDVDGFEVGQEITVDLLTQGTKV